MDEKEGVKAREKTKDQDGKKSSRIKVRKRDVAGSKREGEGGWKGEKVEKTSKREGATVMTSRRSHEEGTNQGEKRLTAVKRWLWRRNGILCY